MVKITAGGAGKAPPRAATWNADIGKHDIDRVIAQEFERRDAVARLADNRGRELDGDVDEQFAQTVAGQRLVIDDQDFQGFGVRHGRKMRTS